MMGKRLPETCRAVIPIKLEFSASIGFIHKKFVKMHGYTILKKKKLFKRNKCNFSSYLGAAEKESLFFNVVSMYGKHCW
jgi:hypothetical protein